MKEFYIKRDGIPCVIIHWYSKNFITTANITKLPHYKTSHVFRKVCSVYILQ